MTRHQRRRLARKRKDAKAKLLNDRALRVLAMERTKANLSQPHRGKRTPTGMVSSIYLGNANPLGYTRPMKVPAKGRDKGHMVTDVATELRPAHKRDAAKLETIIRQAERLVRPPKKR